MTKLLVQTYHRTLGPLRGKVRRAICYVEAVIIVETIHVSVAEYYRQVPGPQLFPLIWVVGEHAIFLVNGDEFHGFVWEDYDCYWIPLIILVVGEFVHKRVI